MKYGYLDKNIKAVNMQQFLRSQSDWTLLALVEDHVVPPDATMVAVHGVKRGNSKIIEQAIERNIPWVYMDNAGYYFPEMYKRITINETAPQFLREGKRFEHNVQLKPWRGGSGKNILVLPLETLHEVEFEFYLDLIFLFFLIIQNPNLPHQ
jgi:hypothetical protein